MSCDPGQTSIVAATSSSDCYDPFVSIAPFDFIDTPDSAWTRLDLGAAANMSAQADLCQEACKANDLCQYWRFRAAQSDTQQDGCQLKLAPAEPAPDTYTAFKLGVGDYTVFQVGCMFPAQRACMTAQSCAKLACSCVCGRCRTDA